MVSSNECLEKVEKVWNTAQQNIDNILNDAQKTIKQTNIDVEAKIENTQRELDKLVNVESKFSSICETYITSLKSLESQAVKDKEQLDQKQKDVQENLENMEENIKRSKKAISGTSMWKRFLSRFRKSEKK